MTGYVIALTIDHREAYTVWVEQAPVEVDNADVPQPLDLSGLPDLDEEATTKAYAAALRDRLMAAAPVKVALDDIFRRSGVAAPDLKFQLRHARCEGYSWEAIFNDKNDFLGLASRANLSRQVKSFGDRTDTGMFQPPLRMLAVMSALGISARPQWLALRNALGKALSKREVTLQVLVAEAKLRDDIVKEGLAGVTVDLIPASATGLFTAIEDAAPHVLHFFCHGRIDERGQSLELMPAAGWMADDPTQAVNLGIQELCREQAVRNSWLVVLNCCLGAAGVEDEGKTSFSMAMQLVKAGAANAIGMSSPIDAADAHVLAETFYARVVRDLGPLLGGAAGPVVLDFASALGKARDALAGGNSPGRPYSTWTLPRLYEAMTPLRVVPVPRSGAPLAATAPTPAGSADAAAAMQTRLQIVAAYLRNLPGDAPDSLRDAALALLQQDPSIPRQAWPGRDGRMAETAAVEIELKLGEGRAMEEPDHA